MADHSSKSVQLRQYAAMAGRAAMQGKFDSAQSQEEETAQLAAKPNNTGLPDQLKSGIESLSGQNMDHVRVHYNSTKPAQLQAHAYAQGSEIHLAPGQEQHLPHEAWHVVQQRQGRVKATAQAKDIAINDDAQLEKEADVMGEQALQKAPIQHKQHTQTSSSQSSNAVAQGRFYEKTPGGAFVWWNRPIALAGGAKSWRSFIDPATGTQQQHNGYGVWFQFNKGGTDRQKVKGTRAANGNTPGLTLGDQTHPLAPMAWTGSRNWPATMKGVNSALNLRGAVPGAALSPGNTAWGHQVAMQWGGPAAQWNAASATNDGGANQNAQEQYQTEVENAVNRVAALPGRNLDDFRIKHTAYMYSGTHVAKYMRIKIYWRNAAGNHIKLVDQVTPDFALHMAGGAGGGVAGFGTQIANQLTAGVALATRRQTDPTTEMSWNATPTAARPRKCFLTTACVDARGLADDCEELSILRAFRDGPMQALPGGAALVQEYYRIAPAIVDAIQSHPHAAMLLDRLYGDLVQGSIQLIGDGKYAQAMAHYRSCVLAIRQQLQAETSANKEAGLAHQVSEIT
ncbi:DUF4157 domain-containing protein [Duganella sp. sic0402]|nr:DUF4157 domain-containing protein [Duganella sp. sic0402]